MRYSIKCYLVSLPAQRLGTDDGFSDRHGQWSKMGSFSRFVTGVRIQEYPRNETPALGPDPKNGDNISSVSRVSSRSLPPAFVAFAIRARFLLVVTRVAPSLYPTFPCAYGPFCRRVIFVISSCAYGLFCRRVHLCTFAVCVRSVFDVVSVVPRSSAVHVRYVRRLVCRAIFVLAVCVRFRFAVASAFSQWPPFALREFCRRV